MQDIRLPKQIHLSLSKCTEDSWTVNLVTFGLHGQVIIFRQNEAVRPPSLSHLLVGIRRVDARHGPTLKVVCISEVDKHGPFRCMVRSKWGRDLRAQQGRKALVLTNLGTLQTPTPTPA